MTYVQYTGTTSHQETPDIPGYGVFGPITCEPLDIINVPAAVATWLLANESSLWASAADPTQVSKHLSVVAPQPPTVAAATGAGTSPPAPVVSGNDTKGQITFGTGTSAAAGAQVTVTFHTPYATGTTPRPLICAANAATAALEPYVVQQGQTGFQIALAGSVASSQANTVYAVTYSVIG